MARTRGLSFAELLIVSAILVVLAALVTIAVVRAKDSAKEVQCRSNLGQIGKSLILYAADFDGFAPHYLTRRTGDSEGKYWVPARPDLWRQSLMSYAKSQEIFYCPKDRFRGYRNVRWNSTFSSYETVSIKSKSEITQAGTYRMHIEENMGSRAPYARDIIFPDYANRRPEWWLSVHGDRLNCVYLDGRVTNIPINGPSTPAR